MIDICGSNNYIYIYITTLYIYNYYIYITTIYITTIYIIYICYICWWMMVYGNDSHPWLVIDKRGSYWDTQRDN